VSLLAYEKQFSTLRLNTRGGGKKSPHKVALLLAVIELIEHGEINDNRIEFNEVLKNTFSRQFETLAGAADRNNPHLPYFHLRSSGFWHHQLKPGKSASYSHLTTASGPSVINEHIAYVYLDDELFELLGNRCARDLLKAALCQNLTNDVRRNILDSGDSWDWLECEAVVQDYFAMLNKELSGLPYSKAEHRRALVSKLNNRSEGSIEFKHQNISAVLLGIGQLYIKGYKPAINYQQQLKQVVLAHLAAHQQELDKINASADLPVEQKNTDIDWAAVFDPDHPELIPGIAEQKRAYLARRVNFTEREQKNRSLGECGEAFVMNFECFRLERAGRPDLAKEVEWSSKENGDGLGYDIRSFNLEREEELFIEVKTTSSGKYQPFFISDNELEFSRERARQYSLYRVYEFSTSARFFQLPGAVDQYVNLQAKTYKASFN
jgi:hypothetical protein